MTTHIMLDLETWGRTPGSDIRSIGAVVFDPFAGIVGGIHLSHGDAPDNTRNETFYIACDNPTIPREWQSGGLIHVPTYKLTREPETVQWWNEQSPEAQAAFENPVDMRNALQRFTSWIVNLQPNAPITDADIDIRLWANDPHFDVSILEAAYRAVGLPHPWHYRAPRSFRTVVELSGMSRDDMRQFDTGTAHNALDDAISQAKIVCEAYKRLGLNK